MNKVNSDLTQVLEFPSMVFPAPQAFRFDAPVGWIPVAIEGTAAAVRLDEGADSFSPNVLISVERMSMSREEAIRIQSSVIGALDSVAILDELDVSAANSEWHAWEYAYTDKRAGTLVQLFALAVASQAESKLIVTLVGSVDAKRAEELLPAIRSILRSVVFL